jgi:hypothetical protein
MKNVFRWFCWFALAASQLCATSSLAADFAVSVSPPRFEIQLKPAQSSRQIVEITNASNQPSKFKIKTADWSLSADGSVVFQDDLAPQSCRPWVVIERRELVVPSKRPYRFRFEVSPPPDTPAMECRFALLIEGEDQIVNTGSLGIPYSGRFGVIVYAAIGDVAPKIDMLGSAVQTINGKPTAVLKVKNSGTAHGRLEGFLSGVDASGKSIEFAPTPSPILPGATVDIVLIATRPGDPDNAVDVQFPVTAKGKLEWGSSQSQLVDLRFSK